VPLFLVSHQTFCLAIFWVGTHTECQYSLLAFGVPVYALPVTYEGELKTAAHLKWLNRRQTKEAKVRVAVDEMDGGRSSPFDCVGLPGLQDVLLGRGKTVQDHVGNIRMRGIVSSYLTEYKKAAKLDKALVALKVVTEINEVGGRFLKRNSDGWWEEVSNEAAREKVSMTFRTSISSKAVITAVGHRAVRLENGKRPKIGLDSKPSNPCFSVPFMAHATTN